MIRYSLQGEQSVPLRKVISHFVHEINNPLAAISGFAQLCLTTSSVEKQNDYMQTIHDQAGRCRAIVGELSSLIKGAGHEEN
jgi:nitrogen-specific signal transduction histidine kinase